MKPHSSKIRPPFTIICILAIAAFLVGGCAFPGLQNNLDMLAQTASISGKVLVRPESDHPTFVTLSSKDDGQYKLYAYWLAYTSGKFHFPVAPGFYYLFAFEDKNEDATFQPDEWIGWYGAPSILGIGPGETVDGVTLTLRAPSEAREKLPALYTPALVSIPLKIESRPVNTVVSLSDPRFGPKYAQRGLWEPVKFIEQPGAGLYFLEPYNPGKIPVLYVHGAGGYPQQWTEMINNLDRSRFQPWILCYPSGLRLGLLGEFLEKYLAELQLRQDFQKMFIVAHSMGGLISRSALNHQIEHRPSVFIKRLITIATPWQGHRAANRGITQAPAVVPSWYDMIPESPFLQQLHHTALPEDIGFYLLFGYRGDANDQGELNDGTVMLKSVLDDNMLNAATRIYGFDETHVSLLSSQAVIKRVNQILAQDIPSPHQKISR